MAGQLTPVTLTVTGLLTTLSVSWQGPGLGWQLIPGQYLYSGTLVARLGDTYTRFLKAVSLAGGLSLTAAETAYLATPCHRRRAGAGSTTWPRRAHRTPPPPPGCATC